MRLTDLVSSTALVFNVSVQASVFAVTLLDLLLPPLGAHVDNDR